MFAKQSGAYLDVLNSRSHNIDYFNISRLPGEPAAGVADLHFHPVESRALRLTLSVAY